MRLWIGAVAILAGWQWGCSADPTADAASPNMPAEVPGSGYATSDTCQSCHPSQYASWHASYHRTMTQPATPPNVLGDFDDVHLQVDGAEVVLSRRDDRFFAQVLSPDWQAGEPPEYEEHEVVLVTGRHHLQIYWFETGRTRILGYLPVAWDRVDERWFPAEANFIRPPQPEGVMTAPTLGNWNRGCIACHVTDARPKWLGPPYAMSEASEFGIACEACHGPAKQHAEQMRNPSTRYAQHLGDTPATDVVDPEQLDAATGSQICGRCHSVWRHTSNDAFREYLLDGIDFEPGDQLSESGIAVVRGGANHPGDFWPDGEVKPSGREYNGLIESPCFRGGEFRCMSCHSMHPPGDEAALANWRDDQLAPGMRGNDACLQCHESFSDPEKQAAHTLHRLDSPGSECQNCHMPYTNLGLRKAIRSHTISSPSVATDQATGRPNACNGCHLDRPLGWTARALADGYGHPIPDLSPIERGVPAVAVDLLSGDAALRALAAWALGWAPAVDVSGAAEWAPPLLATTLRDPYPAVRYHAKRSLLRLPGYQDTEYDWVAPAPQRTEQAIAVTRRWIASRRGRGEPADLGFLLTSPAAGGADLTPAVFDRLAGARDNRPVEVRE